MPQYVQLECLECGYTHEAELHRGEYAHEDWVDFPEMCEQCGESLDYPDVDDRWSERRQMGITF